MSTLATRIKSDGGRCRGPFCTIEVKEDHHAANGLCAAHYWQEKRGTELKPLEGTLENLLVRVVKQPDLRKGNCRDSGDEKFIGLTHPAQAMKAAQECATCPLMWACREWALETHEGRGRNGDGDPWPVQGVWGGMWFKSGAGRHHRPPVDLVAQLEEETAPWREDAA